MHPSKLTKTLKILPPILTILLVIISIIIGSRMSLSGLISYQPSNIILAAVGIVVLFAIKSLSVIFPLSALYIVSAFWFGTLWGIIINYIGLIVCVSVPYWIGHHFGSDLIDHLIDKYPKLQQIQKLGISNQIMLSYLLRIVSVLPGDLCSLFLGACSTDYKRYLIGSLLGLSPVMILHVLFADLFSQSLSGGFLSALTPKSLVTIVVLIGISVVSSLLLNKKYSNPDKTL